jgi:hypothetical protein
MDGALDLEFSRGQDARLSVSSGRCHCNNLLPGRLSFVRSRLGF